jgi:hypothetical protein
MKRLTRSRLTQLERHMHVNDPPINRLFFLIPDLWPAEDQQLFHDHAGLEALADLVARRTGVRPTFSTNDIWAITVPASREMLAMDAAEKAVFLEEHETRPLAPWQRRERACG